MFRVLKFRPPQGWAAVIWELAIVTLGVLLALAAQQWVEGRSERIRVEASKAALREELAEHYDYLVEFRTVYPCIEAQLTALRDRVLSSGPVMGPVPVYREANFHYVIRMPTKEFPSYAWHAAVNDGMVRLFDSSFRRWLAGHYAQLESLPEITAANNDSEQGLVALTHKLPLESTTRYSIAKEIEQLIGRVDGLDLVYGQLIENIQKVAMLPDPKVAQSVTQRYGTYKFCKEHGLPMRPFEEAMRAIPN
jgi:hypothetical protein